MDINELQNSIQSKIKSCFIEILRVHREELKKYYIEHVLSIKNITSDSAKDKLALFIQNSYNDIDVRSTSYDEMFNITNLSPSLSNDYITELLLNFPNKDNSILNKTPLLWEDIKGFHNSININVVLLKEYEKLI